MGRKRKRENSRYGVELSILKKGIHVTSIEDLGLMPLSIPSTRKKNSERQMKPSVDHILLITI